MLGSSTHTIKKNTEAVVVASKDIGLGANAEKSKHMTSSQDQHVEQDLNIKVKVKVELSLEQATKAQRGSRCIALLFLQPLR